ncbi:RNA-binding domain-containing protein [Patescibacteria group bacterium]
MALLINIDNLIKTKTVETERVEFKKGWNPEDVVHSVCGFANDLNNLGGGYVIIGVEQKDGVPILPPLGLVSKQVEMIQKKVVEVCNKIQTNYVPVIEVVNFMGKLIVVLWIPGGDNRPYKAPISLGKGRRSAILVEWVRKGSSTVRASDEDKRRLLELASKTPFDDRVNHSSDLEDINADQVRSYLEEVKSELCNQVDKLEQEELFRKMNVAKGPNEYLKPVNIGLLMFSNNPTDFFRGAEIQVVIYKDEIGDSFEEKYFRGPIHKQLRDALEFIGINVIKSKTRKVSGDLEALRFNNYPFQAIKEALANAVYHKSYEHQSCIEVSVRLDRIDILSFPGPLPPLDNKILKQPRIIARNYRNRRIGDFLKELRLTEGRSTGIPKIRSSMKNNGSPIPVFKTDDDSNYFLAVLPIHPEFTDPILDEHKKSVLNFCKSPKSRRQILSKIGLTNHYENFRRHVLPLLEVGYLDYTLPDIPRSRKQKYIISSIGIEKLRNST